MTRSDSAQVRIALLVLSIALTSVLFFAATIVNARAESVESATSTPPSVAPLSPPDRGRPVGAPIKKLNEIRDTLKERVASTSAGTNKNPPRPKGGPRAVPLNFNTRAASTTRLSSTTLGVLPKMKEHLEQRHAEIQKNLADRKIQLRSQLASRGQAQFEKVLKRLQTAVDRLGDISDRIDSRIGKIEGVGVSMEEAKKLLVIAKGKISEADLALGAMTPPLFPDTPDASTTPAMINNALKPTRDFAKKAEEAIRAAQKALGDVVKEIKKSGGSHADEDGVSEATTTRGGTNQ